MKEDESNWNIHLLKCLYSLFHDSDCPVWLEILFHVSQLTMHSQVPKCLDQSIFTNNQHLDPNPLWGPSLFHPSSLLFHPITFSLLNTTCFAVSVSLHKRFSGFKCPPLDCLITEEVLLLLPQEALQSLCSRRSEQGQRISPLSSSSLCQNLLQHPSYRMWLFFIPLQLLVSVHLDKGDALILSSPVLSTRAWCKIDDRGIIVNTRQTQVASQKNWSICQ